MEYEDVKNFIGKRVSLTISNGYYFKGLVTNVSETTLSLIDIREHDVALALINIIRIEEVEK